MKFHRDFGHSLAHMRSSPRFLTAINYSSVIYQKKALCTWIPKNGCSNLRYSIAIANGLLDSSHDVNWIHANNDAFRAEIRDCYDATYSFVFLRCPLERIVSAFLNKMVDYLPSGLYWSKFGSTNDYIDMLYRLTFFDFINLITSQQIIDEHWQAQSDFLLLDSYSDYFNMTRYEDARRILKDKIDFELIDTRPLLKHDLSNHVKVDIYEADFLPVAELYNLKSRGIVPSAKSLLSERTIRPIFEFWRSDFELFQHHFAPPGLWTDLGIKL